jgi:hypothetical protein
MIRDRPCPAPSVPAPRACYGLPPWRALRAASARRAYSVPGGDCREK